MNFKLLFTAIVYITILVKPGLAQIAEADFDIMVVPISRSAEAPEYNFAAPNLLDRGFSLLAIDLPNGETLPLGEVDVTQDSMTITLEAGEAVRLWSSPIPLNATAVHFTANVQIDGPEIQQSALAIINSDNPVDMAVTIAQANEIPNHGPFSFELKEPIEQGNILLQFIGPKDGVSTITLNQMRLMKNATQLDYALANTAISRNINFGSVKDFIIINEPPTVGNGTAEIISNDTHSLVPELDGEFCLHMQTQQSSDILQVAIPLQLEKPIESQTTLVYVEAYIKRMAGTEGVLSLALFNSESASGGNRDYPISSLPLDQWVKIETTVRVLPQQATSPLLILQVREGAATLRVDDISLHKIQDTHIQWDASVLQLFQNNYQE